MPTEREIIIISAGNRWGRARTPVANVSNANTISASPANTAKRSPNARCTEALPRRVDASSKQGKSSCISEAQWSSSIAAAAAFATAGSSCPHAQATAKARRGRIRAPPGNTEYRIASASFGGQSGPITLASAADSECSIALPRASSICWLEFTASPYKRGEGSESKVSI